MQAGCAISRSPRTGMPKMMGTGTAREKRALARWKRLPTPASGFVEVVCILFAAEYLQRNFTPVAEENTTLIDVPKRGEAVTVDLVFGRLPGGDLLLRPNQRNLGFSQQSCHPGPFGLRSSRVSILSSKRPYGLTCSQISGVRARRSVAVNLSAQCGRASTCCIMRVLI
jgi:hypothetical protein